MRGELGLTGTHLGCEHGVCGACTVLFDGEAVRGCLMLAVQAEGAASRPSKASRRRHGLNRASERFRRHHALQCGFCTPGMVLALHRCFARAAARRSARSAKPSRAISAAVPATSRSSPRRWPCSRSINRAEKHSMRRPGQTPEGRRNMPLHAKADEVLEGENVLQVRGGSMSTKMVYGNDCNHDGRDAGAGLSFQSASPRLRADQLCP